MRSPLPLVVLSCAVLLCLLFASALLAGTAAAATTRFASPDGNPSPSECTAVASPCTLVVALGSAQAGDTLSLANGTFDLARIGLPGVPLHWAPTDPQSRPVLTSAAAAPTLRLTSAQSGTSFEHLEIDNTDRSGQTLQPALQLETGVAATVRSSLVNGRRCVEAAASGPLTIEDSTLLSSSAGACVRLGAQSSVRRSTVGRSPVLLPELPGAVMETQGLVEDTDVTGGLFVTAPTAVARRVTAIGAFGIRGQGLIVDSVAKGFARDAAAITADAPQGGTLRVVNSTAVSTGGPGLLADAVHSDTGPVVPNDLEVTNSIARGKTNDIEAPSSISCALDGFCDFGRIHIDHSDFVTRAPLATEPAGPVITEGAGNQTGDPLFADAANDDYHLRAGSPAIDAGVPQDLALPADLDGLARVQGSAPDLGAFETSPPAGAPGGDGGDGGGGGGDDRMTPARPAVLSRLRITPSHFHVGGRGGGTRISFRLDAASTVTLTFQRVLRGHRKGTRCLTGRKQGRRCTILRSVGHLTLRKGRSGTNTVRFSGRLARKALPRGSYRVTATPAHGKARTTRFTVIGPPTRHRS
jgi:hypothetical protein